jgi:hypothetical protein
MEKPSAQDVVKYTILRLFVVIFSIVGFGFLFFRSNVFELRMMASQFLTSGITAAIFYTSLHTLRRRDGIVALFVWYIVLTFSVEQYNWWLAILNFAYIAGIASAVYLYWYFIRREIVRGLVQRVAAAGVMTGVANAVIIVFLWLVSALVSALFAAHAVFPSPGFIASAIFRNLQFGTLIGIGFGIGADLAEYIVRRMTGVSGSQSGLPHGDVSAGVHHDATVMHGETIVVTCASCGEELELTPAEVAAEAYICSSCGKPGTV